MNVFFCSTVWFVFVLIFISQFWMNYFACTQCYSPDNVIQEIANIWVISPLNVVEQTQFLILGGTISLGFGTMKSRDQYSMGPFVIPLLFYQLFRDDWSRDKPSIYHFSPQQVKVLSFISHCFFLFQFSTFSIPVALMERLFGSCRSTWAQNQLARIPIPKFARYLIPPSRGHCLCLTQNKIKARFL